MYGCEELTAPAGRPSLHSRWIWEQLGDAISCDCAGDLFAVDRRTAEIGGRWIRRQQGTRPDLTFDKAGKQTLDKSPKKNHAAVHNAKFIAKGRFGGSYSLDGKGDYLRIPNSSSIEIPASRVIGIAVNAEDKNETLRLVLTDSQVLVGKLEKQKLQIEMSGSKLSIPFKDVQEFGYRISASRSLSSRFSGAMMSLRDGQRLLLAEFKTKLQIECDYGKVDLPPGSIVMIRAADVQCSSHVVLLPNGSRLSGVLVPRKWIARVALGDKLEIGERQLLALTSGGVKSVKPTGGVTMKMLNGDTLYGKLTAKSVGIRTEFGEVSPDAAGVMSIVVTPKGKPPVVMTMWSGAVHRGEFVDKQVSLSLSPGGPTVKVSTAKIASIAWDPSK